MSYFPEQLAQVIKHFGSAQGLSNSSGLANSTISRFLSGKMRPDASSLSQICKALPDPEAAKLLESYLLDSLPEGMRYLVRIEPTVKSVQDERDFPSIFQQLRPESQRVIEEIARLFLEDIEIAETFRRWIGLVSPKWAMAEKFIETMPSPSKEMRQAAQSQPLKYPLPSRRKITLEKRIEKPPTPES